MTDLNDGDQDYDDYYQVGNMTLRSDEFGNFAAGYVGMFLHDDNGWLAVRLGGIAFANRRRSNGGVREEDWLDRGSAPMIDLGAMYGEMDRSRSIEEGLMSPCGC